MKEILEEVIRILEHGGPEERVAVASIVSASGSLPMSRRSRMLVASSGAQQGTVGGGCLEAEVHALAGTVMRQGGARLRRFTLTEAKAGAEGLNCGGTVEILIEALPAGGGVGGVGGDVGDEALSIHRQALASLEAREETVLATVIEPRGSEGVVAIAGRALVGWKGLRIGSGLLRDDAPLTRHAVEEGLAILGQDRSRLSRLPEGMAAPGSLLFLETISTPPVVYLFGGGHVSLAVARVARVAGFRIVVVDDRAAFANPERFPEADLTLVAPMETAFSRLPIDRHSYVVAVTRGHQHDEPVIEQALATPAAYIGMIGSRRKVAIMWKRLRERGITDQQLARVHAPIGVPIGGDSPGEIAVSIVAQMIQVRRRPAR